MIHNKFLIISGGPGVGKTTLLNYLFNNRGYPFMPEVARAIIAKEVNAGGDALPWGNRILYMQKMFEAELLRYNDAMQMSSEVLFFDRSIIDVVVYAKLIAAVFPPEMQDAAASLKYHPTAFILPPWKEIYTTDSERKQSWDEAIETYEVLKQTYIDYAYSIIEVPPGDVAFRADFVLARIN